MTTLGTIISFVIALCCLAVLFSVFIDFVNFDNKKEEKQKKKSIVATGSMFIFFVLFYFVIKFRIGEVEVSNYFLRTPIIFLGIFFILLGTYVNIKGRFDLGKNWANHIKIYKDHKLIETGVYKIVRHPLYASLIWAFYGASFAYLSYTAFLLNTLLFIPFMFYRAKQEENLLSKEFPEYKNYKLKTGMFFPKIIKL